MFKKINLFIFFSALILHIPAYGYTCDRNKEDSITITSKFLIFLKKEVYVKSTNSMFNSLLSDSKKIVKNSYGNRKTIKKNDLEGSQHITICYANPIKISVSSFSHQEVFVNSVNLPYYYSDKHIPIVINEDRPMFSDFPGYRNFIKKIHSINLGDNQ